MKIQTPFKIKLRPPKGKKSGGRGGGVGERCLVSFFYCYV